MRPSRSDRVARRSGATEPRSGCKGPRHFCEASEFKEKRRLSDCFFARELLAYNEPYNFNFCFRCLEFWSLGGLEVFSETPDLLISQKRKQPSQLSSFTFPCSRGRLAND